MEPAKWYTDAEFDEKFNRDNMPELDESISCMYCESLDVFHLSDQGKLAYCCILHNFEICGINQCVRRCDDFKSRYDE